MRISRSPSSIFLSLVPVLVMGCSGAGPSAGGSKAGPAPAKVAPIATPVSRAPETPAKAEPEAKAPEYPLSLPPWTHPDRDGDEKACKVLAAAQQAASKRDAKLPKKAMAMGIRPLPCMPAQGGAWGLVQTINKYSKNVREEGYHPDCGNAEEDLCVYDAVLGLAPTFVTQSGNVRKGKPFEVLSMGEYGLSEESVGVFDLDGDGVDELLYHLESSGILTVANGAVVPYPAAEKLLFDGIVDVDLDGRPDLSLPHPYTEEVDCGERGGHGVEDFAVDPLVVARSMPDGTFSTSDPAAQAITKKVCPAAPKAIVVKDEKGNLDNKAVRRNVVCARLWGVPEKAVTAELSAGCPAVDRGVECDAMFAARDGQPTSVCAGREALLRWAKATPPTTLR